MVQRRRLTKTRLRGFPNKRFLIPGGRCDSSGALAVCLIGYGLLSASMWALAEPHSFEQQRSVYGNDRSQPDHSARAFPNRCLK
jgi:hypothetical protein